MTNTKDSIWKLLFGLTLITLMILLLQGAIFESEPILGTCIYEAVYFGPPDNYLAVAWTHPPCSSKFSRIIELEHMQMQHSKITTNCGRAIIYSHPHLDAPMADTFPQLCTQQMLINPRAGGKNGEVD